MQVDVGRVTSMEAIDAGNTNQSGCSAICAVRSNLLFLASWLGPSILISLQSKKALQPDTDIDSVLFLDSTSMDALPPVQVLEGALLPLYAA